MVGWIISIEFVKKKIVTLNIFNTIMTKQKINKSKETKVRGGKRLADLSFSNMSITDEGSHWSSMNLKI